VHDIIRVLKTNLLPCVGTHGIVIRADHHFHIFYESGIISRSYKGEDFSHFGKPSLLKLSDRGKNSVLYLYNIFISYNCEIIFEKENIYHQDFSFIFTFLRRIIFESLHP
jgi:hypothetical protein